jgi:biopolymer transport protein ExbD
MQAGSDAGDIKAEINVTPLVDVCLVLLIIFMVITPMLQKGKPVTLPVTSNPVAHPDSDDQLLVSITKDGGVWLDRNQIPKDLFMNKMTEEYQRSATKSVIVKADKSLTFGDVKDVMLLLNKAGFEQVGLVTERPQTVPGA